MFLGQVEQMVFLHAAGTPEAGGFFIPGAVGVAFKHGEGQLVGVNAQPFLAGEEFPAPRNHFLLEIIAQAPVTQHFKEGQVGRITHVIDITGADALLHVGQPGTGGMLLAQQIGNQGMHTGSGEKHGGVIFRNQGSRGNQLMALFLEETQEKSAQFVGSQGFHFVLQLLFKNKSVPFR